MPAMLRAVLAAVVLLFPLQAWAFRGRPVSDLRFASHSVRLDDARVASDGTDFLVLSREWAGLYTQKIVGGREAGPRHWIADDGLVELHALIWTGSEYVAAWGTYGEVAVARISREGSLLGRNEVPGSGRSAAFAAKRHSAMLVEVPDSSILRVQPLALNGEPRGERRQLVPGVSFDRAGLVAAGDGFIASLHGAGSTWLLRLHADGTMAGAPLLVHSGTSTTVRMAQLLRLGSDGGRMGGIVRVREGADMAQPLLAWSGIEVLLLAVEKDVPQQYNRTPSVAVLDPATLAMRNPVRIGLTPTEQPSVALAAARGQYFAAWLEIEDGTASVRASRIDSRGSFLDGEGIVLDGIAAGGAMVEGRGPRWFVVWSANGEVRGRQVSDDGTPGPAIVIGAGSEAAVCWTGSAYLVLRVVQHGANASPSSTLYSTLVMPDGSVGASQVVAEAGPKEGPGLSEPVLVVVNGQPVAFYLQIDVFCWPSFSCPQKLQALRLDSTGAAVDSGPFEVTTFRPAYERQIYAASDGERVVVSWSHRERDIMLSSGGFSAYAAIVSFDGAPHASAPIFVGDGLALSVAHVGAC